MRRAEELPGEHSQRVSRVVELLLVMLDRSRAERPFLILTDAETLRFVQFAGSREEPLLVDCPHCKHSERFPGVRQGAELEAVALSGCALLSEQLGTSRPWRWIADLQWDDPADLYSAWPEARGES